MSDFLNEIEFASMVAEEKLRSLSYVGNRKKTTVAVYFLERGCRYSKHVVLGAFSVHRANCQKGRTNKAICKGRLKITHVATSRAKTKLRNFAAYYSLKRNFPRVNGET